MISISGSVGRLGNNNKDDAVIVQGLLNQNLPIPYAPIKVDGDPGNKTIGLIEGFQRLTMNFANPSGLIAPNSREFTFLSLTCTLPAASGGNALAESDFETAAKTLGCEVAAIKAVNEIESAGSGYFASGRPKILFEAHIFSRLTKHAYDKCAPDISSKSWNKKLYKGGEAEYDRLEKAMALDRAAALQSASWGRFQIMGFHYAKLGYTTVDDFIVAMYQSEGRHLEAFVSFIKAANLTKSLTDKNWADFARGYNGAGYAENQYDTKLKKAYDKYAAEIAKSAANK
ncbi:MAG: N-acetylmuramidase family protein [Acidobacteriota bacterium]